jgi:hypothetical protein
VVILAGVVITGIVITAIGVAVPLAEVDTIKAPEARLFAAVGRATRIPTFRVVGGMMAAVGVLLLAMAQWLPRAFYRVLREAGRRMKIGGTLLTLRSLVSRFGIFPGLGAKFQHQDLK